MEHIYLKKWNLQENNHNKKKKGTWERIQHQIIQELKEGEITLEQALLYKLLVETKKGTHQLNYGRTTYPEAEAVLAELIGRPEEFEPLEAAVEQLLNAGKDNVTVVDLMSGPERMQALIERLNQIGINTKGKIQAIAIGLHKDTRTGEQIETDKGNGIFYLIGDVMTEKTWLRLDELTGGSKTDILISDTSACIVRELARNDLLARKLCAQIVNRLAPNGKAIINFGVNKQILYMMFRNFIADVDTGKIKLTEMKTQAFENLVLVLEAWKNFKYRA